MASDTILVEWCDFHKAGGEPGLDCWGAGLDGQDSCDKTTRPMRLVPTDVTLYVECPADCGKLLPGRRMQRDFCPACDSLGVVEVTDGD